MGAFLSALAAMILGVTVLPLKVLYDHLKYAITLIILAPIFFISIMTIGAHAMMGRNVGLVWSILLSVFIVAPLTLAFFAVLGAIAAADLIVATPFLFLASIWNGLSAGFLYGMEGFIRAFNALGYYSNTVELLEAWVNPPERRDHEAIIDEIINNGIINHEAMDNKEIPSPTTFNLLAVNELGTAEQLIHDFAALPAQPDMQSEVGKELALLKTRLEQYKDLSTRLNKVKEALIARDQQPQSADGQPSALVGFDDEIIVMQEITMPVLFIKQYTEHGEWHAVPAISKICDKNQLTKWLVGEQATHPISRDPIATPTSYNGKATRYVYHKLTKENCFAEELNEGAAEIRTLSSKLSPSLVELRQADPAPASVAIPDPRLDAASRVSDSASHPARTGQAMFASSTAANTAPIQAPGGPDTHSISM